MEHGQDNSLLPRVSSPPVSSDEHPFSQAFRTTPPHGQQPQAKAADVNQKLVAADETKKSINEKREQFRPVATRGSVLYFSVVELSLVNVMYQTSLDQFLDIFMGSMDRAEKASLASKR